MKAYWKYTAAAMAVVAALSLTGCGQQTQQAEQPQLVKAIQVGSERAGTTAGTYSGTVKGRYQSNLSFQAGGRITARNVQLGSQVHAGDVLMTVDPKDIAGCQPDAGQGRRCCCPAPAGPIQFEPLSAIIRYGCHQCVRPGPVPDGLRPGFGPV